MGQHFFLNSISALFRWGICALAAVILLFPAAGMEAAPAPAVSYSNDLITFTIVSGQTAPVTLPELQRSKSEYSDL